MKWVLIRLFEQKRKEAEVRGKKCAYYVKVLDKNPDPAIVADLQDELVRLKPASAGNQRDFLIFDPEVDWAELLCIDSIHIENETAIVRVIFSNGFSGIGLKYRLSRKVTTWESVGL